MQALKGPCPTLPLCPTGEPLSPRQNLMKEMLETIRQGVSLKPVCLSREVRAGITLGLSPTEQT